MDLSVIIPTFNRKKLLEYTLISLGNQIIGNFSFEIIIIDDGSSDGTYELVERFKNLLPVKYYYQEDKGYRVASARNLGILNSLGDIIVFVDSGMILPSKYLFAHWNAHKANIKTQVVVGYMLFPDVMDMSIKIEREIDSFTEMSFSNNIWLDYRENIFSNCNDDLSVLPAPWSLFWTGNASLRKANLLEVGTFDEEYNFRWGMEDIDLGYRLYNNNSKFILSREAVSIHFPHESDTAKKSLEEEANKAYFHLKFKTLESLSLLKHSTVELNNYLMDQSV